MIASNPNTVTAGKNAGFQINPQNPLCGLQGMTSRMDKTIMNLKKNIIKGNM